MRFAMADNWMDIDPAEIAVMLLVVLVAAYLLGQWIGRRRPQDAQDNSGARVTDAALALMGLLLGFTFAMALAKYDHRRETVVNDSNSIGDFYTCVCVLKDSPQREQLRRLCREYVTYRLELARSGRTVPGDARFQEAMNQIADMQSRMTDLVRQVVSDGTPIGVPLVNTLNEVTSAHAARAVAVTDRLPSTIVELLFLATTISMALLGWQQGAAQRKVCMSTFWLMLLVVASLYITLDLNQPYRGLIKTSQAPMEWLLRSMGPGA
jgi:hypothetical protein